MILYRAMSSRSANINYAPFGNKSNNVIDACIMKRSGPNTEPCGTPEITGKMSDWAPSIATNVN